MKKLNRARAYVAKMPPAISGQGGHDRTFHVACVLAQGFDLTEDEAWVVLCEYSMRCEPPWTDAELRHKLEDAMRAPSSRPKGYLLHAPRVAFQSGMLSVANPSMHTGARYGNSQQGVAPDCKQLNTDEIRTVRTVFLNPYACALPSLNKDKQELPKIDKDSVVNVRSVRISETCKSVQVDAAACREQASEFPLRASTFQSGGSERGKQPSGSLVDEETGYPIIDGAICPF